MHPGMLAKMVTHLESIVGKRIPEMKKGPFKRVFHTGVNHRTDIIIQQQNDTFQAPGTASKQILAQAYLSVQEVAYTANTLTYVSLWTAEKLSISKALLEQLSLHAAPERSQKIDLAPLVALGLLDQKYGSLTNEGRDTLRLFNYVRGA